MVFQLFKWKAEGKKHRRLSSVYPLWVFPSICLACVLNYSYTPKGIGFVLGQVEANWYLMCQFSHNQLLTACIDLTLFCYLLILFQLLSPSCHIGHSGAFANCWKGNKGKILSGCFVNATFPLSALRSLMITYSVNSSCQIRKLILTGGVPYAFSLIQCYVHCDYTKILVWSVFHIS